MGEAFGQMLPSAVGVAISPLPIVAVVLMLATPRGRVNGPAFILGWWVGLAVVGVIVLAAGSGAGDEDGAPPDWANWLDLVLGVLLLAVAVRQWRSRPHGGEEPPTPKWMGALDAFSPVKAGAAGVVLSALNPKNLLLAIAGAAAIARVDISTGRQILSYVVFVLIASIGVAAPVVLYFALGDRSKHMLDGLNRWMTHNNAVIMAVLMLIIGIKLIGDAISGFSA